MFCNKQTYIQEKPDIAINWSYKETIEKLKKIVEIRDLKMAFDISTKYPSPVSNYKNSSWIKKAKIIGINPRIAGSYFNIVKYAMTFPEDTIHIMPLWEQGCNGSIYARINWHLSHRWIDPELVKQGYDTPEKQLKLVVNLLHAIGKKVGFDAVGHTDKFSEEVFILPDCFEWIKLNKQRTEQIHYEDTEDVYPLLKKCIIEFLEINGCADSTTFNIGEKFYTKEYSYKEREKILFGIREEKRMQRRVALMKHVRKNGFETIPVTEHAPSRPIVYKEIVNNGEEDYADFTVHNKNELAIIFNALTPYRWYKIDNKGYPEINSPIEETFNYFFYNITDFQQKYNFDFFRADMAHNQLAHAHYSEQKNKNFDKEMWKLLKQYIQKKVPYFASLAEAFFSDYYIDGISDMKNKNFDIVLGISNFLFLDSTFLSLIKQYHNLSREQSFAPCLVSITNDSDQKINNKYHCSPNANEIRYFMQMFLDLPGYTGMGFEVRNLNPQNDEEYSGIYTNAQPKTFCWGSNKKMFSTVSKIRKVYSTLFKKNFDTVFLKTISSDCLVWLIIQNDKPQYLCTINLNKANPTCDIHFKQNSKFNLKDKKLVPLFSLKKSKLLLQTIDAEDCCVKNINFADARIYKIKDKIFKTNNQKNKNQVLFVTTEYTPYAKSGGLADYSAEYTKALKENSNIDIRVIMPLYNSNNACFLKDNSYIELYNKLEFSQARNIRYHIIDTNIEVKYNWGVNESTAKLYKIKNPVNNICVYLVYSPAFSEMNKEYTGNFIDFPAAFNAAVCELLKPLKKSSIEKFAPAFIQTNDHLTGNTAILINDLKKTDHFYRGINLIHTIHNISDTGKYSLLTIITNFLDRTQIEQLCKDSEMCLILDLIKNEHKNKVKFTNNISVLKYLYTHCDELTNKHNKNFDLLMNILKDKFLDNNCKYYEVTKEVINCCDKWITVSKSMYDDLVSNKYGRFIENYFEKNKEKGCSVLSGINNTTYNPSDSNEIKFPYNKINFEQEKEKNKIYLQKEFSIDKIATDTLNPIFFTEPKNKKIWGHLNENPNAIILLFAGRNDKIKGFEIIKEIIPEILEKYSNIQVIISGEGIIEQNINYLKSPNIDKFKNSGKLLFIDNFINIKQFLASSDLLLLPSYIESCALIVMQAMRYGTLTVAAPTGCVKEIVISPDENKKIANGFKTTNTLYQNQNAVFIYKNELEKAVKLFSTDKESKNRLIANAMVCNNSWDNGKIKEYKKLFKKQGEI